MPNELYQPDGGELQPYHPGGDLAPYSPAEDWGNTPVDYLDDRHERAFGQLDPAVEANVEQIASVFETDMASLGFVQKDIQTCISFFRQMLVSPPTRMPAKKHNYEAWQFSHDIGFQHFLNFAHTQRFPKELIQSIAFWLQQLDDFQHGVGHFAGQQQHAAPVSADPADALSDSQYEAVLIANERAAANTMGYLRDLWGSSFDANLRMVQSYFQSLPARDQEHLSQYSTGWIKATNTVEVLTRLYAQAIGSSSLPSGGAIQTEIEQHEYVMKHDRKRWNSDERLQARYRELLRMRGY